MKKVYVLILLSIIACDSKIEKLNGKWSVSEGDKRGKEIILKDGTYTMVTWNDDLVNKSSGLLFVNENSQRQTLTLTLVPDLTYSEGDTILLKCENIDIIKLSSNQMTAIMPTRWFFKESNKFIESDTIIFKKVK